jgi:hypothetical protein
MELILLPMVGTTLILLGHFWNFVSRDLAD